MAKKTTKAEMEDKVGQTGTKNIGEPKIKHGDFVTENQLIADGWKRDKVVGRKQKHQIWARGKKKLTWNTGYGQCAFI